ncbi:MAG: Phage major capsid protein family [Actinomycetia bacterium]|nr:Phage major capsid protein family [Actinomycetes bacterium]
MNEQELRDGLAYVRACLRDIHTRADGRDLTDEERTGWDAGRDYIKATERTLARYDEVRSLAGRTGHIEGGDGAQGAPNVIIKADPYEVLASRGGMSDSQYVRALTDGAMRAMDGQIDDNANQAHFEKTFKRHAGKDVRWAENILARTRPEYISGFSKLMTSAVPLLTNEERAAMQVGSNTAGGYLLPTHLDPTIILTNAGSSNVIRGLARTATLTEGETWNGVTSAGVTASWDGELVEVSDDSPTFGRVSVPVFQAQAFVQASVAAFEDIMGLTNDVMMLFSDARDRLEGVAHATGSGTGQPKGVFTAIHAVAGSRIVSTTAAAIGLVDLQNVYTGVPVRWRGRTQWLYNPVYAQAIKALGTALSASYSTNIAQGTTDMLLNRPVTESDDAPTTQTTTALDDEVLLGEFSNYLVVDKPGGMSVEFVPQLFNTANNLPDGRRGWFAYWRGGADVLNAAAFRLLVDKTSA